MKDIMEFSDAIQMTVSFYITNTHSAVWIPSPEDTAGKLVVNRMPQSMSCPKECINHPLSMQSREGRTVLGGKQTSLQSELCGDCPQAHTFPMAGAETAAPSAASEIPCATARRFQLSGLSACWLS